MLATPTDLLFLSWATNLDANASTPAARLYDKNLSTGVITLLSSTTFDNWTPSQVQISADGSKLIYQGQDYQAYVLDVGTGVSTKVSTSAAGVTADGPIFSMAISADGAKVAFETGAGNLTADTASAHDLFIKDLTTGAVTRVTNGGFPSRGASFSPAFSPDGSKLVFTSYASNFVSGDTNNDLDVFVYDLATGAITMASKSASGQQSSGVVVNPIFSPDSSEVAFLGADVLVPGAPANSLQVYVKSLTSDSDIDGAGGTNTISYANFSSGVSVSLRLQGQAQDVGGGNVQTLHNFQNIIGSQFNDMLAGDSGDNVIDGGAGANTASYAAASGAIVVTVTGSRAASVTGDGSDTLINIDKVVGSTRDDLFFVNGTYGMMLDGGGGTDTVSFAHATSGVTANLSQSQAFGGASAGLSHIQNVIGSAFNDTLTGDSHDNVLTGGAGADTFLIVAGAGHDTITDFSHAEGDRVDLSGVHALFSFAEVRGAATQSGSDTVIDLGGGNSLTLANIQVSDLTPSDFILLPIVVTAPGDVVTIDASASLTASGNVTMIQFALPILSSATVINNGSLTVPSSSFANLVASVPSGSNGSLTFVNNGTVAFQAPLGAAVAVCKEVDNTGSITVTSTGSASGVTADLVNSGVFSVHGHSSSSVGVMDFNSAALVQNQATGILTVSSDTGQTTGVVFGNGFEFDNAGTMTVSGAGLSYGVSIQRAELAGPHTAFGQVNNSGVLTVTGSSSIGIYVVGLGVSNLVPDGQYNIINSGSISAQTAIQFYDALYYSFTAAISNTGTITGDVLLSSAADRIVNSGTINGAVNMGAGNNTLDSHLGAIHGAVTLGAGSSTASLGAEDNTVSLGAGTHIVDAGGGTNTVTYAGAAAGVHVSLALQGQAQSTGVGADTLTHFQTLVGSNYGDLLGAASTGASTLTGGTGADIFRVTTALTGAAAVTDFSQDQGDKIDLSAFGSLRAFSDVVAAAQQVGSDTVITLGGGGTLTLTGITLANLTASDFVLPLAAHASFDLTGDHRSDLLFRNPASGDWGYAAMTASGFSWRDIGVTSAAYAIDGTGDFNGDGVADILFHNHVSGDWGFAAMTATGGVAWHGVGVTSAAYSIDATGDFNGDGVSDILFRNHATGDWGFAAMDRNGGLVWNDKGVTTMTYAIDGTGDFNGDGITDVLLRNHATGDWGFAALDRNGGVSWTDVGITSTAYPVAGLGDFNGDGTTDVLFRNPTNGDWGYMAM
ncbi:MAG: beta strand repeat-containing protein, partial [Caulobacteraceae bacterium]